VSLRARIIAVVAAVLWLGWFVVGSFYDDEARKAAWWLPDSGLRLGLDLQGGVHIVIGPDLAVATEHELSTIQDGLERGLERDKVTGVRFVRSGQELRVQPATPSDAAAVRKLIEDDSRFTVREDGADLVLVLTPAWADDVRERAMLQALEVLRRRIDDPQTGIPESVITRQGQDRILIEIPGVDRVPDIFRKTGFLEFKIVQDAAPTEELLRAKHAEGLPPGTEIAVEKERQTDRVITAYLVPVDADINGDFLTDAQVQFDNRVNEWQVTFTWSAEGGQIFGELTEKNIGKPLAIILDDQVYSAPVIRDRISRQGQISGRFSSEEARDLAVVLRAGALPIPVQIEEERTIGPALGQDSIRRGIYASLVGLVLVVGFTVGYYRLSGGYASLALLVNLVLLVGLMALFEGTLTMPGIAGLVLTVGMAVDANVIIFERIREELRAGRTPRAAIGAGFQKALWTILDANITTLITALVLFEYGTGPIKGFAVTLSVGILTSVFAALVVTRILYEVHPGNKPVTQLSI
jgi:preprotein translocase subunit SecD